MVPVIVFPKWFYDIVRYLAAENFRVFNSEIAGYLDAIHLGGLVVVDPSTFRVEEYREGLYPRFRVRPLPVHLHSHPRGFCGPSGTDLEFLKIHSPVEDEGLNGALGFMCIHCLEGIVCYTRYLRLDGIKVHKVDAGQVLLPLEGVRHGASVSWVEAPWGGRAPMVTAPGPRGLDGPHDHAWIYKVARHYGVERMLFRKLHDCAYREDRSAGPLLDCRYTLYAVKTGDPGRLEPRVGEARTNVVVDGSTRGVSRLLWERFMDSLREREP